MLDYLAELARDRIVELEIGIESCNDAVLARVRRGHDFAASVDGARQLSALPIRALKMHQLQLVRGTALARDWQRDPAAVPLLDEQTYLGLLADFVERLSPDILLQRLGSEVPPALKLAPHWNLRLSELAPRLSAELERRGSWQGCRYQAVGLP